MNETKCIKNCTKARMTRKAEERTKAMIEWLDTNCPKMTKEEIINGLKLTIGECLFDPYTVDLSTEQISFTEKLTIDACNGAIDLLEQEPKWIPVSERLPHDLEPVNITWVNHNPESYYADIKDKPFTATGVYFNGKWYWWSTLCTDILAEYGHNHNDIIDDNIEIIAWQPLPQSYMAEQEGEEE